GSAGRTRASSSWAIRRRTVSSRGGTANPGGWHEGNNFVDGRARARSFRGQYAAAWIQGALQRPRPRRLAGSGRAAATLESDSRRADGEAARGEREVSAALDRARRRDPLRRQGAEPADRARLR